MGILSLVTWVAEDEHKSLLPLASKKRRIGGYGFRSVNHWDFLDVEARLGSTTVAACSFWGSSSSARACGGTRWPKAATQLPIGSIFKRRLRVWRNVKKCEEIVWLLCGDFEKVLPLLQHKPIFSIHKRHKTTSPCQNGLQVCGFQTFPKLSHIIFWGGHTWEPPGWKLRWLLIDRQGSVHLFLGLWVVWVALAVRPQTEHAASLGDGPHSLVRLDVLVFGMPLVVERTLSKASQKPYVRILLP